MDEPETPQQRPPATGGIFSTFAAEVSAPEADVEPILPVDVGPDIVEGLVDEATPQAEPELILDIDEPVVPRDVPIAVAEQSPSTVSSASEGNNWAFVLAWALIGLGLLLVLWALISNA